MMESKILSTKDYKMFKAITSNREVDDKHVRKLMASIEDKNLLHLNPILVNEAMQIVDGQHRLEAAMLLKVPIYYVIDNNIGKSDISLLNKTKKNWGLMDYINFYTIEKKPGYDELSALISKYPECPVNILLKLIAMDGYNREWKDGYVDVSHKEEAERILQYAAWFGNYLKFAMQGKFLMALQILVRSGQYDHDKMIMRVEEQPRSLVACITITQYVEMLEEIYNYRSSKNRVKFS
jgi:hypothetical protein